MLGEKETAKAIRLLQGLRDQLGSSGDSYGAGRIDAAISSVILASDESTKPPATDEQLAELVKRAEQASDFRTQSRLSNSYVVKSTRRAILELQPVAT